MPTFTMVISDEPFSRDDRGPAPFIESIEHGANGNCSTPATEAFKRCLDVVAGTDAGTLAENLRGALSDLFWSVQTAWEDHEADADAWDKVGAALDAAEPLLEGFNDKMRPHAIGYAPLPWRVAERDLEGRTCVRAANGDSVLWANSGADAEAIIDRMNKGADGCPLASSAQDDDPEPPSEGAIPELERLDDELVDGLEVLRAIRDGKRMEDFDLACLGDKPENEFEARRRIMNIAGNACREAATALRFVRALAGWPHTEAGEDGQ